MRQHLNRAAWLPLALLAACNPPAEDPSESAPADNVTEVTEAPEIPTVEVTVTLGAFDSEVTDIAAIEASPLGFQSRILAANGSAGVQMIQVDGTYLGVLRSVLAVSGRQATQVSSTYAFGPQGRAVQFVPNADGLNTIELVKVDAGNEEPERTWFIDDTLADLCVSGTTGLVVTSRGKVGRFEISPDAPKGAPIRTDADISDANACFETRNALFVRTQTGIVKLGAEGPEATDFPLDAVDIVETETGFTAIRVAQGTLLVNGSNVQLLDGNDNAILPREVEVEGGNFGGILRDGVVVVLGEDNRMHLAAWSAVANIAGVEKEALSRRMDDELGESALSVEENLDALKPREALPGFEETELPQPPSVPADPDR
ncbi:MAG: hypothetical protein AAGH41_03415 [Pseudomonadota bacterium]